MRRRIPTEGTSDEVFLLEQRFRYDYSSPVRQLRHRLMIQPRFRHGRQRLLAHGQETDGAACEMTARTDRNGNRVLSARAAVVDSFVEFRSWARVDARGGRPPVVPPSALVDRRWTQSSPLTEADEQLRDVADVHTDGDVLDRADAICEWTNGALTYAFGATHVGTTALEALLGGRGVCQDYAHLMLAVCRTAGIAARYVSGHLVGEGGSHAWVEVFAPTSDGHVDVVAYDPTHRRRAGAGYLTVAVGRDYRDVPPTSGSFEGSCAGVLSARKRLHVMDRSQVAAAG